MLFTADSHRDNGKRFIVSANEKLAAFLELESQLKEATREPDRHPPFFTSLINHIRESNFLPVVALRSAATSTPSFPSAPIKAFESSPSSCILHR